MHQIQEEIGIPKIIYEKISDRYAIIVISPLPQGYGMTLGNAIRRVLLSSLPGSAVTGIKIEGVSHEYSSIKGIKDSVLDIILNLKSLEIKKTSKDVSYLVLDVKREGEITAKDIKCPSDVVILNPDLYISNSSDKNSHLKMEIRVEKGVGYKAISSMDEKDPNMILVDGIFSPIERVKYNVEATRVGQMTNLDKLTMEIFTKGSISPDDALKFAANVLKSYFSLFDKSTLPVEAEFMSDFTKIAIQQAEEEKNKPKQESYTPIEILGLSPRSLNALINGGIGSIEQLVKSNEIKLLNLRGFGKKALTEVKAALRQRDLKLIADEDDL